jgi:ABC-2 type transport system permease protein
MPWFTALGGTLAPLVGGLFMAILKDPAWARRHGLIAAKAQLTAGTADWPAFWALLAQAVAVGGLGLFALIAIWVFGREFSDRTAKDLLAVPTARRAVIAAKFIIVAVWSTLIALLIYLVGIVVGATVGLPGWSPALTVAAARQIAIIACLTVALVTPFAFVASAGRGYLPAVGVLFLVIVMAQILAAVGWGVAFPWSVPALMSGIAGAATPPIGIGSELLVVLTSGAGIVATLVWWQRADQT